MCNYNVEVVVLAEYIIGHKFIMQQDITEELDLKTLLFTLHTRQTYRFIYNRIYDNILILIILTQSIYILMQYINLK